MTLEGLLDPVWPTPPWRKTWLASDSCDLPMGGEAVTCAWALRCFSPLAATVLFVQALEPGCWAHSAARRCTFKLVKFTAPQALLFLSRPQTPRAVACFWAALGY